MKLLQKMDAKNKIQTRFGIKIQNSHLNALRENPIGWYNKTIWSKYKIGWFCPEISTTFQEDFAICGPIL